MSSDNAISIFIADDQRLIRGALAALLSLEKDLHVVGQTSSGLEVVEQCSATRPDVILMDIEMPDRNGLQVTEDLTEAGLIGPGKARVIIVTTFGRPGYLQRALAAGASGFLIKDTPPDQLAEAIRKVHLGQRVLDPELAEEALFSAPNPLTEREIEICQAAQTMDNASVDELAATLHLSPGTVRNHLSSIIAKTNTRNRHAAIDTALKNGWL